MATGDAAKEQAAQQQSGAPTKKKKAMNLALLIEAGLVREGGVLRYMKVPLCSFVFATAHLHQLMPPAACMRLETLPIVCSAEANIAVCKGPDLNVNNCLSAVKPLERQHLQCTTCHGMCMQSYWE